MQQFSWQSQGRMGIHMQDGQNLEPFVTTVVVPHVHFHIIPRMREAMSESEMSWRAFGRGQREDLDEDEAVELVRHMRARLIREIERIRQREGDATVMTMFEQDPAHNHQLDNFFGPCSKL